MDPNLKQAFAEKPARGIARAAGSVSAATFISRILGLFREVVIARYFGAGFHTDAFYIALRIPNLFRDLFAEGALSSAFVPTFVRALNREGKQRAWQLGNRVCNTLGLLLLLVAAAFYFGARPLVLLLAGGFASDPAKLELTVQMTQILSPFLLFVALAAVMMGMLNALGSFFIPAIAPATFNISCILAGLLLSPLMPRFGMDPIVAIAVGALAGGAGQFLVQVPALSRYGFSYRFTVNFSDPGLRRMGALMLPAIVGLSATQVNIVVDSHLASRFGDGPVSWLNYAFRLMQLPIGLFGVALATANLSAVSHQTADEPARSLRDTVSATLRLAACLTLPSTVGLILFRREIVQLIYEGGNFLAVDTRQTAEVLVYYALALFAYSAVKILVPTFYALDETKTPVRISFMTVAFKIAMNFVLIGHFGFLGLAMATAAAAWLNFVLLLRAFYRKTDAAGWGELQPYAKITLASLVMGAMCAFVHAMMEGMIPGDDAWDHALNLGTAILVGVVSLVPLLHLFRVEEASDVTRWIYDRWRQR